MNDIRIHTQLESTTLVLPEIAPLLGKQVEIIVREQTEGVPASTITPGTGDWEAFRRAADELRALYDFESLEKQDQLDSKDSEKTGQAFA